MSDDPLPDAPSYDELGELKQPMEDFDDLSEWGDANEEWYNAAVPVAARLIVQTAREYPEYRTELLEADEVGIGHKIKEYDNERGRKLAAIRLSAFQGGSAENLARDVIGDDDA